MTEIRSSRKSLACVELFAGVGGLALGASAAGISHLAMVERDKNCCVTIRHNRDRGQKSAKSWHLIEDDVCKVDFAQWAGEADIVCGGPPCQPFSVGGKGAGHEDKRDMFPQAVRAVAEIQPDAFVFENVRGLLRPQFSNYVEYIRLQLTYPQVPRTSGETAEGHLRRLQKFHTKGDGPEPVYQVEMQLANAANYGVPQNRERVFIVGFRRGLHAAWAFPQATHTRDALLRDMATGSYYERHKVPKRLRVQCPQELLAELNGHGTLPWRTLRDAISDLGVPGSHNAPPNHFYVPGARSYDGHTGSLLDLPAKTVKAGGHGVPGGENMLITDNGDVRYLTVRESARVQTFPDDFEFPFPKTRTVSMRQLGNAVPSELSHVVFESVRAALLRARSEKT